MKANHTLAKVIKAFNQNYYDTHKVSTYIQKTFRALLQCRTASMGGHVQQCADSTCKHIHISYNSCRNRHCSSCQSTQKEQWLSRMRYRTLPVAYYHAVFTIPHEFNGLCLRYPTLMYDLLFKVTWATINGFSKHPQYGISKTGMTAVLHTWGQNLSLHPHLHCIIPAGGLAENTKNKTVRWKHLKGNNPHKKKHEFLYPMDELKKVFKAKFMAGVRKLIKQELIEKQADGFLNTVFQKEWVAYAKRPFGGAEQVIEYLGRYTHKVAISNHRIQNIDNTSVKFAYKDYKDKGKTKSMSLEGEEFLRRFSQHILPSGFTKIRHFGLHAGANQHIMDALFFEFYQKDRPALVKEPWQTIAFEKVGYIEHQCPKCKQITLKTKAIWQQGKSPPFEYKELIISTK
jgi:phage FluMu protein Com